MPVTPFHFGPGALFKCAAPGNFSWTVFAFANGLIDLEPVLLFFFTGDPAHPWLHTAPGAIAVAIVAATAGRWPCAGFLRWRNRRLGARNAQRPGSRALIGNTAAWSGALAGTISHILLDAVMHIDVRPFWPFFAGNPLQGLISIELLQWGCVLAGVFGVSLLALLNARSET